MQLDALTERTRNDYLYARAMVGRELAAPEVRRAPTFRTGDGAIDEGAARCRSPLPPLRR